MKKILSIILILMLLMTLTACGAASDAEAGYAGGIGGSPGTPILDSGDAKGDGKPSTTAAAMSGEFEATEDAVDADFTRAEVDSSKEPNTQIGSGMLTAGEWKDLDNIQFWTELLNNNDWFAMMERRNLFVNRIISVKIVDANNNPCFNVPVHLKDDSGAIVYKAVSDINGNAYLLFDLDHAMKAAEGTKDKPMQIVVAGSEYQVKENEINTIVVDTSTIDAKQLDLLFMIDTTGSMGDELSYLQYELRDVIRRVTEGDKAYSINLSVNFYRDSGDQYVVRSFEFSGDIEKSLKHLSDQSTNGGGDYAEAVHLALEDVVENHQWRDDSVKLCFMVLDAPPHNGNEIKGIDANLRQSVMAMAEKGIRFIPVASSGVDTETEFLLRSWAVMTGGTYTFLTNHSGIGNDHLEPTIGEYQVEKLNDLLVRIISEYCGIK